MKELNEIQSAQEPVSMTPEERQAAIERIMSKLEKLGLFQKSGDSE